MARPRQKRSAAGRAAGGAAGNGASAKASKPNILVIWGDDIGQSNLSCYTHGLMGYRTPNIDRIANEGMLFTDSYGEQSCTAGRSSFITGQSVYRTGLSKVGIPAAPIGMNTKLVTIAALLKEQGYATGQFGKNHLGDLNEHVADQQRVRRVLRQSLPSQCRRRAGNGQLSEGPEVLRNTSARAASCIRWATDKDDKTVSRAGAGSASRRSRIPAP